jgi:hypothetical protein
MKQLTEEDIRTNAAGTLTKEQLSQLRRKGVVNAIAGACFLVFVPMGIFTANMKVGVLFFIWILGGTLFAVAFLWSAWGYLFIKPDGHGITPISGKASKKNSGNKNVVLKIGERSFFLKTSETEGIVDGEEYTVYYLEKQRIPVGWIKETT